VGKVKGQSPIDNALPDMDRGREIDPDTYNDIARCAQLLGIQLIESSFTVLPGYFEENDKGKLGIEVTELNGTYDTENRVVSCIFEFENYKKKGRLKVFDIKDKFIAFYQIPIDCDEFHAVAFASRVGVMACYPYFRAHVASMASLANADMPIMPTLAKMPVKRRQPKKEKTK
jgi:hypothetical protein